MTAPHVLIIGAGHGGAAVAGFLRQFGFEGAITLAGDEPYLPYHRPPLSKAWLKGETDSDSAALRPLTYYETNAVELRRATRAETIDRTAKHVRFADGTTVAYDFLILATGSRAILPPIEGVNLEGVQCLRSAADAEALKERLGPGRHVAVVGGGYIGLEVAASAIALGASATVIEREERLLARSASPQLASYFADFQRGQGSDIKLGTSVSAFLGQDGVVSGIRLSNGEEIACDLALLGVGALPNCEIAEEAGLACERGILVDEDARTSDRSIFAIGDVAVRPLWPYGRRVRLESVANATEQARQAASAITGRDRPAPEVTWNWSDQFDLKFQVAGLPFDVAETVVRGDPASHRFALFHFDAAGSVQQVEAINAPGEFMLGKKLIAGRQPVAPERIADMTIELKQLLA